MLSECCGSCWTSCLTRCDWDACCCRHTLVTARLASLIACLAGLNNDAWLLALLTIMAGPQGLSTGQPDCCPAPASQAQWHVSCLPPQLHCWSVCLPKFLFLLLSLKAALWTDSNLHSCCLEAVFALRLRTARPQSLRMTCRDSSCECTLSSPRQHADGVRSPIRCDMMHAGA